MTLWYFDMVFGLGLWVFLEESFREFKLVGSFFYAVEVFAW